MRLARIEITNYQSIAHAELELGDWTSLVGTSDVGKSACLRALYSLLTNQRGDFFIRQGEKGCSVLVERDDGVRIEWRKERGKSGAYVLSELTGGSAGDGPERNGQLFDRTAGEVPPEIAGALPMTVSIDGQPFMPGFQRQHDRPFMFGDTARWRAQALGEFDGTNILLLAEVRVRAEQRSAQMAVKGFEKAAERLTEERATLDYLDAAGEAVFAAQRAQNASQGALELAKGVRAALVSLEAAEGAVLALRPVWSAAVAAAYNVQRQIEIANAAQARALAMRAIIAWLEVELPALPEIPDIAPLRELAARRSAINLLGNSVVALDSTIRDLETQMSVVAGELSAFKVCPTCGQLLQ